MKVFDDLLNEKLKGETLGIVQLMSPENRKQFADFLVRKYYTVVYLLENMVRAGYIEASYIRKTLNMEDEE